MSQSLWVWVLALSTAGSAWGEVTASTPPLTLPWFTSTPNWQVNPNHIKPYSPVKNSQKPAVERTFDTVVLENEYLRVQAIPELGNVIYRAVLKGRGPGGKDLDFFYCEELAKDWLPWWESAVKLSFPYYEHGLTTDNQPAGWRIVKNEDGSVTLAAYMEFSRYTEPRDKRRYGRFSGMTATQLVTLRPGEATFSMTFMMHNPTPFKQGRRMWVDTLFPRTETKQGVVQGAAEAPKSSDAQLIYPTTWVSDHAAAALRELGGKSKLNDYVGGSYSLFAWEPVGFAGVYYPQTGTSRIRIADPTDAPGAKFWFLGDPAPDTGPAIQPGKPNHMFNFIELWGGTDHVFEGIENWIGPGETFAFTYHYVMTPGMGEPVYADRNIVLATPFVDPLKPTMGVNLAAMTTRAVGKLSVTYDGKEIASAADVRPDKPLIVRLEAATPLSEHVKPLKVVADNTTLYDGLFPPQLNAKDDRRHARIVESIKGANNSEMRGNADEHGNSYHAAIKAYPEGSTDRGRLLYRDGQLDKALECLTTSTSTNPGDGEGWHLRGVTLMEQGQDAQARASLEKAVAAGSAYPAANYYVALLDIKAGDMRQARERLGQMVKALPAHWEGRLLLAWLNVSDKAGPDAALAMAKEDPADPRVQWVLTNAKVAGADAALAALLKEPGAQKRLDEFVANTQGNFVPPARLK